MKKILIVMAVACLWVLHAAAQENEGITLHVVQRGETLNRIAAQYGVDISELARVNGIANMNGILAGQRLIVPTGGDADATLPETHVVQPGETLGSIARLYGLDMNSLIQINDLPSANRIYIGQTLKLRAGGTNAPEIAIEATAQPPPDDNAESVSAADIATDDAENDETDPIFHIVARGDTLYRIANSYGRTVNDLMLVNGISDPSRIFAGQRLIIPVDKAVDVALDLPDIITNMTMRPLIFNEGETAVIRITTTVPAQISGTFMGRDLGVISQGIEHIILVGVPVFSVPDIYPMALQIRESNGIITEHNSNVRVQATSYYFSRINVDPELLAPATEEFEYDLLERLASSVTETKYFDNSMSLPAANPMNAPFGTRRSYNGGEFDRYHTGTDFASPTGAPIYAAAPGQVVLADTLNIRGGSIMIDHGWGVFTKYSHLSQISVGVGQMVDTGDLIGLAGSTGRVTGAHLHWELWVNGVPVNPMQWVREEFP